MTATFRKKNAHFLTKSQTHGNALVFDLNLTPEALRLILALNSFPETWEIRQDDVAYRLGFNRKKMRKAMDCAEDAGYLKVTQTRKGRARWGNNVFEFDIEPSFIENKCPENMFEPMVENGQPAHNECGPLVDLRPTVLRPAVNGALSVLSMSSSVLSLEEQTNADDQNEDEPTERRERELFVCSLSKEQEKRAALVEAYDLSIAGIKRIIKFSIEQIKQGVAAYEQWAKGGREIKSVEASLCTAIEKKWKANKDPVEQTSLNIEFLETLKPLDYQFIGPARVVVGTTYVEFSASNQCKEFSVNDPKFIPAVKEYIQKLKAA
jgi:hypothetical protein